MVQRSRQAGRDGIMTSPAATDADCERRGERLLVEIPTGTLEVFLAGPLRAGEPVVCAAHPAAAFGAGTADLLREVTGVAAVCVNPRGIGASRPAPEGGVTYTLDAMADDLDAVRKYLGGNTWAFWGMSGGAWLGLSYARRHPEALSRVILESACACFRERLADSKCILSPFHPSWRPILEGHGLIDSHSHDAVGDPAATEWTDIKRVGDVFRRRDGPALLVSPTAVDPEMRAAMPLFWTVDFRRSLAVIRTPALVIAGTEDLIAPLSHVRRLHEGLAKSAFLAVEGGGHVPTASRRAEATHAVQTLLADCRG
jgi:proline iminopeptidase